MNYSGHRRLGKRISFHGNLISRRCHGNLSAPGSGASIGREQRELEVGGDWEAQGSRRGEWSEKIKRTGPAGWGYVSVGGDDWRE